MSMRQLSTALPLGGTLAACRAARDFIINLPAFFSGPLRPFDPAAVHPVFSLLLGLERPLFPAFARPRR